MIITIYPTGFSPIGFIVKDDEAQSTHMLDGDKRGVRLTLWETSQGGQWVAQLEYLTTWGNERPFTRIFQGFDLDKTAGYIRAASETILPPGAGFPATPSFETRQTKLNGMLQTLTLVALSDVLKQVHERDT